MTWTTVSDQSSSWAIQSDSNATWSSIDRVNNNFIPYSEDFSLWNTNAVVSGNVVTDISTTQASQVYYGPSFLGIDDVREYVSRCFSVTVKKDAVPFSTRFGRLRISYYDGPNFTGRFNSSDLHFDSQNGAVYNINYGSPDAVDYGVIDEEENWRFWITSKFNGYFYRINIFPAAGDTAISSVGSVAVTGSMTLVNAQFETSTYPSNYITTNGTPIKWEIQ